MRRTQATTALAFALALALGSGGAFGSGAVATRAGASRTVEDPPPAAGPGTPADAPVDVGLTETAEVRLVLLDVVVVDDDGRTVGGLTRDDFRVLSWGDDVPVDTLDVACPDGGADDVEAVRRARLRARPGATGAPRKIVLAFDYQHLAMVDREPALDQAERMIRAGAAEGDEVMVVALTGGVRIEQGLTRDLERVADGLRRMRYDVSLWNGNFSHASEAGFVRGVSGLFDVLGTVPGRKSVVLFSAMSDVPLETQFRQLAGMAAAARCALYPVDPQGVIPPDAGFGWSSARGFT